MSEDNDRYRLISSTDSTVVESEANEFINEGFWPYGSVAVVLDTEGLVYTQVMVRKNKNF